MFKRFLCILLSLMLAAGMTAALAEEPAAADAGQSAEAVAAAETQEPVLLVTVNGHEIKSDDYGIQTFIEYYMSELTQYGLTEEEEIYKYYHDYYTYLGLLNAIQHHFYEEKADEFSTRSSAEEREEFKKYVTEEWQNIVNSYIQSMGITEESTEDERKTAEEEVLAFLLEQYGVTEESYMEDSLKGFDYTNYYDKTYLEATKDITVTEEELKDYFEELVKEDENLYSNSIADYERDEYQGKQIYYKPEGYRAVTHILLKVDDELLNKYLDLTSRFYAEQEMANAPESSDEVPEVTFSPVDAEPENETEATPEPTATPEPVTQEMIDEAKKAIFDSVQDKIDDIISKFNSGIPFEELIAEYGEDPGMKMEEYLKNGYEVNANSVKYDKVFTDAASSIKNIGEISEPVLGTNGIHIIYYLRDVPAGAIEMTDTVHDDLMETLLAEHKNTAFNEMFDAWQNSADIQYTADGQKVVDDGNAAEAYLISMMTQTDSESTSEEAVPEVETTPEAEESAEETPAPAD